MAIFSQTLLIPILHILFFTGFKKAVTGYKYLC